MTWKGRIIGLIIGLFFNIPGMIIGFLIGYYFFDKPKNEAYKQIVAAQNAFSGVGTERYEHEQIIKSTFSLMGYVSRGAGRINESHIQQSEHIMRAMNLDNHMRSVAIEGFTYGKSDSFNLQDEALKLRGIVGANITMLSFLMEIQVGVAIADEELSKGEHERLLDIANAMRIPIHQMEKLIRVRLAEQQFRRFTREYYESHQRKQEQSSSSSNSGSRYEQYESFEQSKSSSNEQYQQRYESKATKSELATAYEILGVTADTPWDEIRKAHKKLMLKYHPDRLASQGLPPEMISLYTQKAQDIQAAFNLVKKYHGK